MLLVTLANHCPFLRLGHGKRLAGKLEKKGYSQVSFSLDGDSIQIMAKKSPNDKNKDKGAIPSSHAAEILELPQDDADMEQLGLYLAEYDARRRSSGS